MKYTHSVNCQCCCWKISDRFLQVYIQLDWMASWFLSMVIFFSSLHLGFCASATGYNAALSLVNKYSNSSGIINAEQLQKMLDRICNCSAEVNMNDTTDIVSIADENITEGKNASRSSECGITNSISVSAVELFRKMEIKELSLNETSFELACPVILEHLESQACGKQQPCMRDSAINTKQQAGFSRLEVWGIGVVSVTLISLCSLLGVGVLPCMEKSFYKQLLTVLIGLAVGSLTASSLFHLIPQTFNLMNSDIHHNYLEGSLMMWGGIWVFFMTERIMKVVTDYRQTFKLSLFLGQLKEAFLIHRWRKKLQQSRKCTFPKTEPSEVVSSISSPTELLPHLHQELEPLQDQSNLEQNSDLCLRNNPGIIYDYQEQAIKASFGHQEKPRVSHSHGHDHAMHFEQGKDSPIATVAWMVVFGDGLHNFIDGLSIGAAFNQSLLTGISISVAVMCEELPHELGDFAVLLNAGMTMKQALLYNFLSACTCYIGLVFGVILGEIHATNYIFGFASGMFLYIALVDMVPEMNEVAAEASKVGVKNALHTLFLQNIGMGLGVLVLYILARYQDSINFG